MAEPTLDQRTPTLRLRFGSQDVENGNWWILDDTIARAFLPGSVLQLPSPLQVPGDVDVSGATHVQGLDVEGWLAVPNGPVTLPNGSLTIAALKTRTLAQQILSGAHTYNPGPTWQEVLALPAITTRGGPILLAASLGAQIQFTAQPTGTAVWAGLGWGVATLNPPDVWLQQPAVTLTGNTGGTVVQVPMPTLLA